MDEVQDKGLQQSRFGLGPEWVGALGTGRGGALDKGLDQPQHVLVIPHIGQRVITVRRVRAEQIKHPHLISGCDQSVAGLAQDLGFRVCNDHRTPAVRPLGTLQYIGDGIAAAFACTAAADHQHVGIAFMAMAIQPHLKVLGQYEIAERMFMVPIPFSGLYHISPAGRTVFLAASIVLPACHDEYRCCSVDNGE